MRKLLTELRNRKNTIFVDRSGKAHFPNGITKIPNGAFSGNKKLKYAILPKTVESIGDEAFFDCSNLKKLILNDNLKEIAYHAFSGCKKLKKLELPDSVQEIDRSAFYNTYFTKSVISRSGKIFYYCPVVKGKYR